MRPIIDSMILMLVVTLLIGVVSYRKASERRERELATVRQALTQLHLSPAGREVLALGEMVRFETAVDAHYDPLRHMLHAARNIHL